MVLFDLQDQPVLTYRFFFFCFIVTSVVKARLLPEKPLNLPLEKNLLGAWKIFTIFGFKLCSLSQKMFFKTSSVSVSASLVCFLGYFFSHIISVIPKKGTNYICFPIVPVREQHFLVANRKLVYCFRGESIFFSDKIILKTVSEPFIFRSIQDISVRRHIFPQTIFQCCTRINTPQNM